MSDDTVNEIENEEAVNEIEMTEIPESDETIQPTASKSFIAMWDDVLPPDFCDEAIQLF